MSRTKKARRGPGQEYWSKRPISNAHGATPGRDTKKATMGKERMAAKKEIRDAEKNR